VMNGDKESYKETELGWIPKDWNICNINKVAKRFTGHTPDKKLENYWDGDIPWISLKDLSKLDKGYIVETNDYTSDDGIRNSSAVVLPSGTVVISRDATVGKIGIMGTEMATSQHFINFVCDDKLDNIFLYYFLINNKKVFQHIAIGSTIKTIGMKFFEKMQVVLPELNEQQKIATILKNMDVLIENTNIKLENLSQLKKALAQKLLTEGIGHTKFKESEVGRIPIEWEVKKLEEISTILDSLRKPLNEVERKNIPGDIPYYGANGVVDYVGEYLFDENLVLIAEDGGNFSESRSRPIAYKITGKSWVNNHAHILRESDIAITDWLYYCLVHKDITSVINGGTRSKLNQKDLREIKIAVPSVEEQKELTIILLTIDKNIEQYQDQKSDYTQLKDGLMQQLLTGKIRVKIED